MFSNAIKQLSLTSEMDDGIFSNIQADTFENDVSFVSTLRALLFNRISPEEKITADVHFGADRPMNSADVFNIFAHPSTSTDAITVHTLKGEEKDCDFETLRKSFGVRIGYEYLEDISRYLSQCGSKMSVYSTQGSKHTIIVADNLTLKGWHYIQSALPRLIPWYFSNPLNDFEVALLKSLTQKKNDDYARLMQEFSRQNDFRMLVLSKVLNGFGLAYEKNRLNTLKSERDNVSSRFTELQNQIGAIISREKALQIEILGLESALEQGDGTGLADYFICNRSLHMSEVKGDSLKYVVTTALEYFDQNVFEKFLNNHQSYFYQNVKNTDYAVEEVKLLLAAIFGDNISLKVRVCAEFSLSMTGSLKPEHHSQKVREFNDWLPHPHINDMRCLGSNAVYINELMRSKKYIEAIEQTVAATKNINFTDSIVVEKFISTLLKSGQKFIELPNNEIVTPRQALEWIGREKIV